MSSEPLSSLEPRQETMADRRRRPQPTRQQLRRSFWRMLGTVRPHRSAMIWGIVLGFGVALTYATSLAGILPVLKVVVDEASIHHWLSEKAADLAARNAPHAGVVGWTARLFPAADTPADRMHTLLILLGALLVINVVGNVLRVISQYLILHASNRAAMDLRRRMYRKALYVPVTTIGAELSSVISQFLSDNREVFLGIVTLFGKVAREPLKAICVLAVALFIDARLTLVALAIAPPAILLLWYFGRKVRKATVRLLEGYGLMLGSLEETLQGITVVKSYTREVSERQRMWALERKMLRQQLKLAWIEAFSSPLIEVVGLVAACAGIVWLAARIFSGEIDSAQFLVMVGLLAAMLDPIRKIANVYNMVQRSGAAAHRIFQFLDLPEEPFAANGRSFRLAGPPPIAFENVGFRYASDAPRALHDVTFSVKPGECVAIVGPNGSGKSTLLRVLPRLLEPQSGRILIDGRDVREIPLRALRRQIAIVDQRAVIFARTVTENIGYGDPDADAARIAEAARQAFAAEFIEQLPQGFETQVGEFGATLSGGQRQRLSIARAFLKPCSILIFDEATSEIDAESERKIHDALDVLRKGKTTFLIAHRHTVMDMADRIVVMDAGQVVDFGSHAELMNRCPLYVGLYRSPVAG